MKRQKIRGVEDWKIGNDKMMGCPTKAFGHDRRCGFTLVELVIVIAIVIILSVISVPIYRGHIDKAEWSEGYALLGTILSAQKAYYSEYGTFLRHQESSGYTSYEPILGIDARGNKYFTYFHAGPGESSEVAKYYLRATAFKTDENEGTNAQHKLYLQFNVTRGVRIDTDWSSTSSWY